MRKRSRSYIVEQACRVEEIPAAEDNSIAFMPRPLANVSLPTTKLESNEFEKVNGRFRMNMVAPKHIGLPYGSLPRLMLCFLTTKAKQDKTNKIFIGASQTEFLESLGKLNTGSSINAVREQSKRLFSSSVHIYHQADGIWSVSNIIFAESATIGCKNGSWSTTVVLDLSFYREIQNHAVPVDSRVLQACSHYPLAIDVYCWLTYRFISLHRPTLIRWDELVKRFASSCNKLSNFKAKLKEAFFRVSLFYSGANYKIDRKGILLFPSKPHVPRNIKPQHRHASNLLDTS